MDNVDKYTMSDKTKFFIKLMTINRLSNNSPIVGLKIEYVICEKMRLTNMAIPMVPSNATKCFFFLFPKTLRNAQKQNSYSVNKTKRLETHCIIALKSGILLRWLCLPLKTTPITIKKASTKLIANDNFSAILWFKDKFECLCFVIVFGLF